MSPGLRKFALASHLTLSIGWLGAVAAYLALDVAASTGQDVRIVRAAYIGMDSIVRSVIVPLAFGSLLSGLVVSLGSTWGLFRHYWVLISLLLTLAATVVLLVEVRVIGSFADVARDPRAAGRELRGLGGTLVHSGGGMLVLLAILMLNVYKPRGLTRYGWRRQERMRRSLARSRRDGPR